MLFFRAVIDSLTIKFSIFSSYKLPKMLNAITLLMFRPVTCFVSWSVGHFSFICWVKLLFSSQTVTLSSLSHRRRLTFVTALLIPLQVDQRWNETALHPSSSSVTFIQTARRINSCPPKKAAWCEWCSWRTTYMSDVRFAHYELGYHLYMIYYVWLDFQNKAC